MNKFSLLLCLFSMFFTASSFAESVKIPVGEQSENQHIDKPETGATQAAVEAKYGEPISKKGPVGDPPISTWEYAEFIVYFEYDHVIHSVAKFHPHGNQ